MYKAVLLSAFAATASAFVGPTLPVSNVARMSPVPVGCCFPSLAALPPRLSAIMTSYQRKVDLGLSVDRAAAQ